MTLMKPKLPLPRLITNWYLSRWTCAGGWSISRRMNPEQGTRIKPLDRSRAALSSGLLFEYSIEYGIEYRLELAVFERGGQFGQKFQIERDVPRKPFFVPQTVLSSK